MENDVNRLFASLGVDDFPYREFQTGSAAGFPLTQAVAEIVAARRNVEVRRAPAAPSLFLVEGGEEQGAASERESIATVRRSRA